MEVEAGGGMEDGQYGTVANTPLVAAMEEQNPFVLCWAQKRKSTEKQGSIGLPDVLRIYAEGGICSELCGDACKRLYGGKCEYAASLEHQCSAGVRGIKMT